jgi:hypothetical protein
MVKATEPTIVRATEAFIGEVGGETLRVVKGDLFEADHPAVRKWPHLFEAILIRYPVTRTRVEQATAGPGEKRGA